MEQVKEINIVDAYFKGQEDSLSFLKKCADLGFSAMECYEMASTSLAEAKNINGVH